MAPKHSRNQSRGQSSSSSLSRNQASSSGPPSRLSTQHLSVGQPGTYRGAAPYDQSGPTRFEEPAPYREPARYGKATPYKEPLPYYQPPPYGPAPSTEQPSELPPLPSQPLGRGLHPHWNPVGKTSESASLQEVGPSSLPSLSSKPHHEPVARKLKPGRLVSPNNESRPAVSSMEIWTARDDLYLFLSNHIGATIWETWYFQPGVKHTFRDVRTRYQNILVLSPSREVVRCRVPEAPE